jgi:hypothetical protein
MSSSRLPRWLYPPAARWMSVIALAVLVVGACRQPEEQDEAPGPSSVGGSADLGTTAGTSGSAAAAATDGDGGVGQGGSAAVGAAPAAGGEGGADAAPAAGGASAAQPGDCANCLQAQCATEWEACQLDDDCRACTDCLDAQLDLGECVVMELCNIAVQATSDMLLCGLDPCVSECGFD